MITIKQIVEWFRLKVEHMATQAATSELFQFPGIERTSNAFKCELLNVAERLQTDPNYLCAVMSIESGFRPEIQNVWCIQNKDPSGNTCAAGLVQFMPATLRNWGLTPAQVRAMSDVAQLALVERFYAWAKGRLTSPGRVYMATFMPAFMDRDPSFVLGREGDPSLVEGIGLSYEKIYTQNAGLDRNKDGEITVADVTQTVESVYGSAAQKPPIKFQCWPGEGVGLPAASKSSRSAGGGLPLVAAGAMAIAAAMLLRR
jgi:hypothetical protein